MRLYEECDTSPEMGAYQSNSFGTVCKGASTDSGHEEEKGNGVECTADDLVDRKLQAGVFEVELLLNCHALAATLGVAQ